MKKIALVLICLSVIGIGCEEENLVNTTGRIAYIELEGGFFGIYSDDGNRYDPINLPEDFQQDSLRVVFEGKILTDRVSFHMWGKLIELKSIEQLR